MAAGREQQDGEGYRVFHFAERQRCATSRNGASRASARIVIALIIGSGGLLGRLVKRSQCILSHYRNEAL